MTTQNVLKRLIPIVLGTFVLSALFGAAAKAQVIQAASCNTGDVQTAITNASEGNTVSIPAGVCLWDTGVTVVGKGIIIRGAGSSRIIAISQTTLTLGTGSKTLTVIGADPGVTLSIPIGQTLTIAETGTEGNFMTGTVTSYTPATGSLVMNITSSGGTCRSNILSNCSRWLLSATPAMTTTIINNNVTDTPLFDIDEDTLVHTNISNFTVKAGTGSAHVIRVNFTSGGQVVLIHDIRITGNPDNPSPPSGNSDMITVPASRGVIWNCSFDSSPFNVSTLGAIAAEDPTNTTGNSWTTASNMGSLDTGGQGKLYVEDCDFHAMGFATSTDDNGRMAVRYSLYDNSGFGTHGADTAFYGQRYFEFYNNRMVFEGFADGTTFAINNWFLLRGGTFVIFNNTIDPLSSVDYGLKSDANTTVMNLQRNAAGHPCWGAGTVGGANYPAPRQVGFGRVTGTGKTPVSIITFSGAGLNPPDAVASRSGGVISGCQVDVGGSGIPAGMTCAVSDSTGTGATCTPTVVGGVLTSCTASGGSGYTGNLNDATTYVGDSEPGYAWGNSRVPLDFGILDFGGIDCVAPDNSANYIVSGRDYFNGSTAKPGWSAFTYPHPLRPM